MFLCFYSFATLENSGLLFYNGRFNEKHDFITLEIQDGQVVLKYSTGTSVCLSVGLLFSAAVCKKGRLRAKEAIYCRVQSHLSLICLLRSDSAPTIKDMVYNYFLCVCRRVVHAGEPLCAWRGERWQLAHGPHPLLQQGGLQSSWNHCLHSCFHISPFCLSATSFDTIIQLIHIF